MHLHRIKIDSFRNLKKFEISFTRNANDLLGGDRQQTLRSHAIIGGNGAGKSNLIEAIVVIFRDLDLNQVASFDYELDYTVRGHEIEIKAVSGKRPVVFINKERVKSATLSDQARKYLPSNVFVYYSGKNERIERLFHVHEQRFTERMEVTSEEYLPENLLSNFTGEDEQARAIEEFRSLEDSRREQLGEDQLRRLFYCRPGHSQLVLLACLLSDDKQFSHILDNLNISELESALFILKQPYRLSQQLSRKDIEQGDKRFWYARGDIVTEFLDKLWQVAVAPIAQTVNKSVDFRGRTERQEQLYVFLPNKEKLQEFGNMVGDAERFFRYAEAAYIGDLIDEVRINVTSAESKGRISFNQLSEGELQLLTVLGLMRITSRDHCLFLLDEPDTHLNPLWKLRYFDEIEQVIDANENQTASGNSQIIITTHDPIMIGSLRREQVRILRKEGDKSIVETPDTHPRGMGVAGLLKSEMFGLPSTLDATTLRLLQERNELLAKKGREAISEVEEARLKHLRDYLDDLGFAREYRDPLYQLFIQKMYEVRSQPLTKLLTPEEIRAQEALAQEVVKELVKHERESELSALAKELKIRLGS